MRVMYYLLLVSVWLLGTSSIAATTELKRQPFAIGEKLTLSSQILSEQREVMVYTPKDYDPKLSYQVIYLLDAEHFFLPVVGMVESLVVRKSIPESIVIGVKTEVRVRDYLPPIEGEPKSRQQKWTKKQFPEYGGTEAFKLFLTKELFPVIESHYSVTPNRTLIGYSNAGVFGLHNLVTSPQLFTNYLLISPAGWWGEKQIDELFSIWSDIHSDLVANIYLSVAGEGRAFYSNAMRVAANLEAKAPETVRWQFQQFPDESHQSTVYPSIENGLVSLYADFKHEGLDAIGRFAGIEQALEHYRNLSKRYSYDVPVPESIYSELADAQFNAKRNEQAIETLKQFTLSHPNSSFAHSSLGRGYMRVKKMTEAKQSLQKALDLYEEQGAEDYTVVDFLKHMISIAESSQ